MSISRHKLMHKRRMSQNPSPEAYFADNQCKCCSAGTPRRAVHKVGHINIRMHINNMCILAHMHHGTDDSPKTIAYLAAQPKITNIWHV